MAIVLLGGGGHASDVLTTIEAVDSFDGELAFVADDLWTNPERFDGRVNVKTVDSIEEAVGLGPYILCLGYPNARFDVGQRVLALDGHVSDPIVHPSADLGFECRMGPGVVIMGQTWISAHVELASHVHVSYGVTLGHDTTIGAFSSVMPGACVGGEVTVGDQVLLGSNSAVLQGVTIGEHAVVGAGAVVTEDVPAGCTVVGVPARAV